MRWIFITKLTLLIVLSNACITFAAQCSRDEVCALVKKMNPFSVLDKCPMAAPLIRGCKKFELKPVKDLAYIPKFIDKGDTVLDEANKLLWAKNEFSSKSFKYKDAASIVTSASISGRADWRLPTLPELKSLLQPGRKKK